MYFLLVAKEGILLQYSIASNIGRRIRKNTSISIQSNYIIPFPKTSNLTQGMFEGAVSDNFDERIEQKIFHCEIVVDNEKVKQETAKYKPIPTIMDFTNGKGEDTLEQEIHANYKQVKQDIINIVEQEMERIKNDPELVHLVKEE